MTMRETSATEGARRCCYAKYFTFRYNKTTYGAQSGGDTSWPR